MPAIEFVTDVFHSETLALAIVLVLVAFLLWSISRSQLQEGEIRVRAIGLTIRWKR